MDNSCCCRCSAEVWHGCVRPSKATSELQCKGTSSLQQNHLALHHYTNCLGLNVVRDKMSEVPPCEMCRSTVHYSHCHSRSEGMHGVLLLDACRTGYLAWPGLPAVSHLEHSACSIRQVRLACKANTDMLKPSHVQTKHSHQMCVSLQHEHRVHASIHISCSLNGQPSAHIAMVAHTASNATLSQMLAMQAWHGRCSVSSAPSDLKRWGSAQLPAQGCSALGAPKPGHQLSQIAPVSCLPGSHTHCRVPMSLPGRMLPSAQGAGPSHQLSSSESACCLAW